MYEVKRMRVFAGPNGSGKTTIVNDLKEKIPFGVYVNADDIEASLKKNSAIDLVNYKIDFNTVQLHNFILTKGFSIKKLNNSNSLDELKVENKQIIIHNSETVNSYIAADIAEFIRQELLVQSISFSYETVMSHYAKVEFIKLAQQKGYKTYLYFIATEDPEINISRVKVRVSQKGHHVSDKTIIDRYDRSLSNLKDAIKFTDRTFIFDNSSKASRLIAEVTNGVDVNVIDTDFVPNWFIKYLMN